MWLIPGAVSEIIAELVVVVGGRLITRLGAERVRRRIARSHEQRYLHSVVDRYERWGDCYVGLQGITEAGDMRLGDDVTVHPGMYLLLEEEGLEPHSLGTERAGQGRAVAVTLSTAAEDYDRLVLLGDPGCGKTSSLQWLALRYARLSLAAEQGQCKIPVLVELSRYTSPQGVLDFVSEHLAEEHARGGRFLRRHLAAYLAEGRLFFLFDGLNEMPSQGYRERVDRLRGFASSNPDNKFIFTCRALEYDRRFGWPRMFLLGLDETQIERFVSNYLPEIGSELMSELRRSDGALLDLARNPYMLRMMTIIFQRDRTLPRVRALLMEQFVRALLAREKGGAWPNSAEGTAVVSALARLAFAMIQQGHVATAVGTTWAESAVASGMPVSGRTVEVGPEAVLKLGADSNLLDMGRDRNWVQYHHELIQEYFAALVAKERWDAGDGLESLFSDHWWEPTVAVACALIENPDDLVLSILRRLGGERGVLLAARCCVEAAPLLRQATLDATVRGLRRLFYYGIGPLGIRAMDLVARVDYTVIEELVLEPDPHSPLDSVVQAINVMGGKYAGTQPVYMGPFGYAARDRTWDPRAYGASIVRQLGSTKLAGVLLEFLANGERSYGLDLMAVGALADLAAPGAADALLDLLASGSGPARAHAARGLGKIALSSAAPVLTRSLLDASEDYRLRRECATALSIIEGRESLDGLSVDPHDPQLREILDDALSHLQLCMDRGAAAEPDAYEQQVEALVGREPPELLDSLMSLVGRESVLAVPYPLAAALALTANEGFIPELEAALQTLPPARWGHLSFENKLREAIWWVVDAIRETRRLRGRTPHLSMAPRDWSAFHVSPW